MMPANITDLYIPTTVLRPTFCKIHSKDKYQVFDHFDRTTTEEVPYNFQTTPPVSNTEEIMKGIGNDMQNFKWYLTSL